MFKVVAKYLVFAETSSNYYGRSSDSDIIVNDFAIVDQSTELTIFDDTVEDISLKLIDPSLSLSDNSAGSFEFTLPNENVGYGRLGRMITEIYVYQNGDEIWRGRILSEEMDFQNRKKYYCEGELAYLNDTMIPPGDYKDYNIGELVRNIIDAHNRQVADELGGNKYVGIDKFFQLGVVEIHNQKNNEDFLNDSDFTTNFEKTIEVLNNIVEKFKGHIHIRHQNGARILDILQDLKYGAMAGQMINFGENLLDFTRKFDMSKICTAVLALGKLPSDFKPKDQELGSHSGAFSLNAEFLPGVALSRWVDGFGLFNLSNFYVNRDYLVSGGKKYRISCRLPNGMVTLSFRDINNNFISNTKHDGSQWVGKEFSTPSDAYYMSAASYGGSPSVEILPGQEKEIKVPTGEETSSLSNSAKSQIYTGAGIDPNGNPLPDIRSIIGTNNPTDYTTYYNNYYGGPNNTNPQPIENRERYVTYYEYPVFSGPSQVLNNAIIEDRDIISSGLVINTIKITVTRDKVDEEVKYIYKARMDYPFLVYAITDENNAILDSKSVTEIVDKGQKHNDFIDEIITVPPRGKYLYVSSQYLGDNGQVFDFHVWSYNKLYDKVSMYLTVEEVNNGSPYVINDAALATYGWIAKSIEFEVEDKQTLLSKARQYLQEVQFDHIEINVNAADLAYLDPTLRSFKLYELVRCISAPHGLDKKYPVTEIQMPLDKPDQVQYTLGSNDEPDYTEANNDTEIDLINLIKAIPSRESVLVEAKRNATEIMNRYCHGYVTIVEDDPRFGSCIYISDSEDYQSANRMWLWNLNGLGYSRDGGKTFDLALTMDGSIVADFITAGTMSADRIRTGLLIDLEGKNYWNLETGDIALGLNLKTTKIQNADSYYGNENGDTYPTSNADIELGSWIYDRTSHDHEFRSMFGSGVNLVDGMQGFSGPAKDANGNQIYEDWYNPKTGLMEKREKKNYWLYISASMISTGILKGKNGRLWFDLNTGSLWVAGPRRLELNRNGEVLYPDGNGGWTLEPSAIERHIRFEEGALFGYSGAQWNSTMTYQEVAPEYATKNDSMANVGHDQGSKYHIFTAGNLTGGTCEGFLDLVSNYGTAENKQYDVLLAGSNRVHINFGQTLLIGKGTTLWDIDPKILVTATGDRFAIGDPNRPQYRVDLEVYGDTQIGHKLEDVSNEDMSAMDSTGHAPNQNIANKYKGDLVVNGSATFGRNYYTEEVTQTNNSATSSATTRQSGSNTIATGTTQTPGTPEQVTKKVYYDDVNFYANVHIEGEGGLEADHLDVKYNMAVGTAFENSPYSHWDNSWKFVNENESYSTAKTYNDNSAGVSTNPDDFNSISGDLLINGRVQFVGGTVGLPDGRLVIGARESGTAGAYSVPQGYTRLDPSNKMLMKNYYDLIYPSSVSDAIGYNIYNSRFVVEGNSLLFGDVNVLRGCLTTESFSVGELIKNYTYEGGQTIVHYNRDYGIEYDNIYKRFVAQKPFIFTGETDAVYKYFDQWQSSYGVIGKGIYLQNDFPLKINSAIYYEGDNTVDGLIISAVNNNNTLNHSQRYIQTHKITFKGDVFTEDGTFYLQTPLYYVGNDNDGLVIDVATATHPKTGTTRSDASKKVTLKSNLYTKEGSNYTSTLFSNGRFDGRLIDVSNYTDATKVAGNASYVLGMGDLAGRELKLFGTNSTANGNSNRGVIASISSSGFAKFTGLGIGGFSSSNITLSSSGASEFAGAMWVKSYIQASSYYTKDGDASAILRIDSDGDAWLKDVKTTGTFYTKDTSVSSSSYVERIYSNGNTNFNEATVSKLIAKGSIATKNGTADPVTRISNTGAGTFTSIACSGAGTFTSLTVNGKTPVFNGDDAGLDDLTCSTLKVGGNSPVLYTLYNNYSKSIDTTGNVNCHEVFVGGTKRISNGGAGTFSSLTVGGDSPVLYTKYPSTATSSNSINISGNMNCLELYVNGTKRISSGGYGSFSSVDTGDLYCSSVNDMLLTPPNFRITSGGTAYFYQCYIGSNQYRVLTTYDQSDIRIKKDVKQFDKSAEDIVNKVPVKSYTFKKDDKKVCAGFIAQDLEVLDELLYGDKINANTFVTEDKEGIKAINQMALIPILWKAVQELSQEVKDLKEALNYGKQ